MSSVSAHMAVASGRTRRSELFSHKRSVGMEMSSCVEKALLVDEELLVSRVVCGDREKLCPFVAAQSSQKDAEGGQASRGTHSTGGWHRQNQIDGEEATGTAVGGTLDTQGNSCPSLAFISNTPLRMSSCIQPHLACSFVNKHSSSTLFSFFFARELAITF